MLSAMDIMRIITCCDECFKDVNIAYNGDDNYKNKCVFVNDIVQKSPFKFNFDVRGVPNKGSTTRDIVEHFLRYDNYYIEQAYNDTFYKLVINVIFDEETSIDNLKRVVASGTMFVTYK